MDKLQAKALEISQNLSKKYTGNHKRTFNKILKQSYRDTIKCYENIDNDLRENEEVIMAAQWLLDNLYLIEKELKNKIPRSYYSELDVLTNGEYKDYPRIYEISEAIIEMSEGNVTKECIYRFIGKYQELLTLSSKELWSIQTMLKISILKNIGELCSDLDFAQREKKKGRKVGKDISNKLDHKEEIDEILKSINSKERLSPYFTESLLKILRDNAVEDIHIYEFIDEKLLRQGDTSERMIFIDHQKQAKFQMLLGNYINSLRSINAISWNSFFEEFSFVEKVLRNDPAKVYPSMDFDSRSYYRRKIQQYAKKFKLPETFIAQQCIECAEKEVEPYKMHVGYYLIDEGVKCIKEEVGYKELGMDKIKNHFGSHKEGYYINTIVCGSIILDALIIYITFLQDLNIEKWKYILAFFAILIPCSDIVNSILNWSINNLTRTRFIPKMDYEKGIPAENKTIVIIPTIINSVNKGKELLSNLESYYLSNKDNNLYFALLADFPDSKTETTENDEIINNGVLREVKKLNSKYSKNEERFFYLNRRRVFKQKENIYMGYERKRGKLIEFLELLKGKKATTYNVISSDINILKDAKYVITLDSDTELPRSSARKLIGAMSHVLNIPVVSGDTVTRGYGIMQPKINISSISASKTSFARIFSGETGIDTYTMAISDVYQDLFGEGIFTGKGIFNAEVFYNILKDKFKDNSILSHDLIEGCFTRCGLVSDISLIDGYPAYYMSSAKRLHRWTRGDWQLIPYIFKEKKLSALCRWKMIDNLRRSLVAPALIILLALSFGFLPINQELWISLAFISMIIPLLFDVSEVLVAPFRGINLSGEIIDGKNLIKQVFLIFTFVPYNCYLMIDAVIRTIYRLAISKRNLLQWQTAEDAERNSGKTIKSYISFMWQGSIIAVIIQTLALRYNFEVGIMMSPWCLIWFLSPIIAFFVSMETEKEEYDFKPEEEEYLRVLSRKTYSYFEEFINQENNYLAPDNYQEEPYKGIAARTSPTNIGMGLTANICGVDFGYINIDEFITNMYNILSSIESLEKYKGHLYNWYDTRTKMPLYPRYVSTVDSGNLLSYLYLTKSTIEEYLETPIINSNLKEGFIDNIKLAEKEICDLKNPNIYEYLKSHMIITELNAVSLKDLINKTEKVILDIKDEVKEFDDRFCYTKKLENFIKNSKKLLEKYFPWCDVINDNFSYIGGFTSEYIKLSQTATPINFQEKTKEILKKINEKLIEEDLDKSNKKIISDSIEMLKAGEKQASYLEKSLNEIAVKCEHLEEKMDFKMLFDKDRMLFSIGYEVEHDSLGNSYYDLLASECRITSFLTVAKGDIPELHWFKLGRSIAKLGAATKGLVSWSGTMFEYMMPLLLMKWYPNTLLSNTYEFVVEGQKNYGKKINTPWGISESAYYHIDNSENYQYKAHGVPGIGVKRGLRDDYVISPYSTILAMQIDKQGGYKNLLRLKSEGLEGKYGLYEAIDFTEARLPKGENKAIVRNFMVHHVGMSLMALNNVLKRNILQERFHRIPKVKATELLLQERMPKNIVYDREVKVKREEIKLEKLSVAVRSFDEAITRYPETLILSNGSYSTMITNSGSGYSKLSDMYLYRYKEDLTLNDSGMFIYVKDVTKNRYFSTAYEPTKVKGKNYRVDFALDCAIICNGDNDITTETRIVVSSEDNAEVREVFICNNSATERIIEVTSYDEVTLTSYSADAVHPAFSNLFIKTEYIDDLSCVIANRRARAKGLSSPYMMQNLITTDKVIGSLQYETSRVNFIGRNNDLKEPRVIKNSENLTNTVGAVLDPIISLRRRIKLKPKESTKIYFVTAASQSIDEIHDLARKYSEVCNITKSFDLAQAHCEVELKYLGITYPQGNLFQTMASKILFLSSNLKDRETFISGINNGQQDLWPYGISGDLPIVLLKVSKVTDSDLVKQMLKAHEYFTLKGLKVDLLIIDMEEHSYDKEVLQVVKQSVFESPMRDKINVAGGVFIHDKSTMPENIINMLMGVARLVIDSQNGLLISQLKDNSKTLVSEKLKIQKNNLDNTEFANDLGVNTKALSYFNEYGGFDDENREYVISLKGNVHTPAPWINVISNESFGFHVSESGSAYTWSKNSRENKISPWNNDLVKDTLGEALYLRDEDNGDVWSITREPITHDNEYVIRHGFGYSTFQHSHSGIDGLLKMFVPRNENLKVILVTLKNTTSEERKISTTYFTQLNMGVIPEENYTKIVTSMEQGYALAKKPYGTIFKELLTYLCVNGGENISYTGSREEFIGRQGEIKNPAAMKNRNLNNNFGAGIDPCIAGQSVMTIKPGEEKNVVILLGQSSDKKEITRLVEKYKSIKEVDEEMTKVQEFWKKLLLTIEVKTPDKAMNLMLNGWLMYQDIACRLWSRTAFYQSGGAYGFRDQLQDVMSLSYLRPEITRAQIVYSSTRQFEEGDVQHWWHPVVNSGIRTRFSDDLLWLPFVALDYVRNTGDYSVLDEETTSLKDSPLAKGEDERYSISPQSDEKATVYEHCIRAINHSLKFGEHKVPLMGSGDWNDGMSTIGNKGKGESVWLGWFLYSILDGFIELASKRNDEINYKKYTLAKEKLRVDMEENAWDGEWYKRAFFDDGTPLGSKENEECKIDSLAQTWGIISKGASRERAEVAMNSLKEYLILEDKKMILLFTPAFDKSDLEPGYIKGYVAGVRENGGQYTHAATWVSYAYALMGDGDMAFKTFSMINPISHTTSRLECETYKTEPYVVVADIYNAKNHVGRGGWSWYTGSAGWLYRAGIDGILGLKLYEGKGFKIEPAVPTSWKEYEMIYRKDKSIYNIKVIKSDEKKITLNGKTLESEYIPYKETGEHIVEVFI